MSVTLTARSRALVVLLVAALVVATGFTAFAGGGSSDRTPAGTPAPAAGDEAEGESSDDGETQIGTALRIVRNDDGTVTETES